MSTPVIGSGTGLNAAYYTDLNYTTLLARQIDPYPNLNNLPPPLTSGSSFSAKWTGFLQAEYTESYTIYTQGDDGSQVSINGVAVASGSSGTEGASAPIPMTAGQVVSIQVLYDNIAAPDFLSVSWSSPSQAKQLIPQSQLYPVWPPVIPVPTLTATPQTPGGVPSIILNGF